MRLRHPVAQIQQFGSSSSNEASFIGRADEVCAQGFDGIFQRMWLFYLCYSRVGLQSGYLDVQQIVLDRRGPGTQP